MTEGMAIARALITGASGYLGGHIVRQCRDRGIAVAALVRGDGAAETAAGAIPILLSDADWKNRAADFAPDAILHTAAWSGIAHRPDDIDAIIDANIRLGAHLLDLASAQSRPPAFVWAGSFWQYAAGGSDYRPNSLYAASKQAFAAIADYYRQRGLACLGLILHDIYGEDDPRRRLLNLIATALAANGKPIDLTDGTQSISFVHVDDAARAFLHAAELLRADGAVRANGIYAVAGGAAPLREQIDALLRSGDDGSRLRWGGRPHPAGAIMTLPDLPSLPGWRPLIPLREGFERVRHHG